jgi:RHS repeat-associated protein
MGSGVLIEQFSGSGGSTQWNNYLFAGGQLVGMHVEMSGGTINTRYFNKDHLGSIAVITDETGTVLERLSYDAWGKRRHADGTDDPTGSITSQTSRGFTGHEELDSIGLVHMNGRVYDPLLARFGVPDPITENPFGTQGWNRYSYVGNSPVNFTDPSGYCFMGCFWKPIFGGLQSLLQRVPIVGSILEIAAAALCATPLAPVCAGLAAAFITGVTTGKLGLALKAGLISTLTAVAFTAVGDETLGPQHSMPGFGSPTHLANIAGHALVGCVSSVASGGTCRSGGLAAAAGAAGSPLIAAEFPDAKTDPGQMFGGTAASGVLGGLGSVAGGGKFANGAVTGAFGYLFNASLHQNYDPRDPNYHFFQFTNTICSTAEEGCTAQNVFDSLKSFTAPGQIFSAYTLGRVDVPFAGPITQYVDDANLTVYNVTAEGHIFDPGQVQRSVISSPDGSISIQTTGEGIGPNRLFNLDVAGPAFAALDAAIRLRTVPAPLY